MAAVRSCPIAQDCVTRRSLQTRAGNKEGSSRFGREVVDEEMGFESLTNTANWGKLDSNCQCVVRT